MGASFFGRRRGHGGTLRGTTLGVVGFAERALFCRPTDRSAKGTAVSAPLGSSFTDIYKRGESGSGCWPHHPSSVSGRLLLGGFVPDACGVGVAWRFYSFCDACGVGVAWRFYSFCDACGVGVAW
ncbi:MAG: hypothetical protein V1738_05265 [Patescibacteria group bacterium]